MVIRSNPARLNLFAVLNVFHFVVIVTGAAALKTLLLKFTFCATFIGHEQIAVVH